MTKKPGLLEALADVKDLQKRVLERQLFRGYSGYARMIGGSIALLGAFILSTSAVPQTPTAHIVGWGTICAASAIVNMGTLVHWSISSNVGINHLRPVLDLIAPFLVGGLLTLALILHAQYDLLFPMWMWLFGVMNIASRHSMPKSMVYLGCYYILAGIFCFAYLPYSNFLNPWFMGITFFLGEIFGGYSFLKLRSEEEAWG